MYALLPPQTNYKSSDFSHSAPCWKLQLCFILQSSDGSPGSFWLDEHNSWTELGLLTARPDQMSQVLRTPAAFSPHSRVTRMSRGGSHVTLIHARDGFQMDASPALAYRHVSHSIDGVLTMLKFQPSSSDMLGWERGEFFNKNLMQTRHFYL